MKKIVRALVGLIMVLSLLFMTVAPVFAKYDPNIEWEFNSDYTELTYDGETYSNFNILLKRWYSGDNIRTEYYWFNFGSNFVVNDIILSMYEADEYFNEYMFKSVEEFVDQSIKDPSLEIISINNEPWTKSIYANDILSQYSKKFKIDEEEMRDFYRDHSNIGYGYTTFTLKEDINKMKEQFPIKDTDSLRVLEYNLGKSNKNATTDFSPLKTVRIKDILGDKSELTIPSKFVGKEQVNIFPKLNVTLFLDNKEVIIDKNEDQQTIELDVAPFAVDGRTFVPVRGLFESLDSEVLWIQNDQRVVILRGSMSIELKIGSNIANVNGEEKLLDKELFSISGRTFLPLRFVTENLGFKVKWYSENQMITVTEY